MHTRIIFPRWEFPNNLGDSLAFCLIPDLYKQVYPDTTLEIYTDFPLGKLLKECGDVDHVTMYPSLPLDVSCRQGVVLPVNHPKLFSTIRDNFEEFVKSPRINFLTLNFLLQLGIDPFKVDLLDSQGFMSKPPYLSREGKFNIAICPMTKTNGKPSPHPGCDGLGFRYNGNNGLRSWDKLVDLLKSYFNANIYEFSPEFLGLGDYHVGIQPTLLDLYRESLNMDYVITTDGGYHHLFNLDEIPTALFTGTKVTKPEFMALGNTFIPDVHLDCRKTCSSFYSEVFGVEDKSNNCNLECEQLAPEELFLAIESDLRKHYENFSNRK